MTLRTLASLGNLDGKRVLLRADFNVPLSDGIIDDAGRILASIPTISSLKERGAIVVILAHLGRPDGVDPSLSLAPVSEKLGELLGTRVPLINDPLSAEAAVKLAHLSKGDVVLCENIRFFPAETSKNDQERRDFAKKLAQLGDVFVSDGFGVVHRKQASVCELAEELDSCAGLLVEAELGVLTQLVDPQKRPYTVVLGGSKVSDKLKVIERLIETVDSLLIGGGMAFSFLAAKGKNVAASLCENDQLDTIRGYLDRAQERGCRIVLPSDIVVADSFSADAKHAVCSADSIGSTVFGGKALGLDIGPETAAHFAEVIAASETVFWNGPMGVFEFEPFSFGTKTVAQACADSEGITVIGGGDSAAAVRAFGFTEKDFTHISTGGGASLEYLEGKTLPGLDVLS